MAETAQALWYVEPGRAQIRDEAFGSPPNGAVRVRAIHGAISRGTESLVAAGRVPPSEFVRMRAPFMAGTFPFPVKYGYAVVGTVERGPPSCDRHCQVEDRSGHHRATAEGPVHVSGAQREAVHSSLAAEDEVRPRVELRNASQRVCRVRVRETQRTPDVLGVHEDLAEHRVDRSRWASPRIDLLLEARQRF